MDSTQDIIRDISKDNKIEIIRGANKKINNNNQSLEDVFLEVNDPFQIEIDFKQSKLDIFESFISTLFGQNIKMKDF